MDAIEKWLRDNGYADALADYDTPQQCVIMLLEHYKALDAFVSQQRELIEKL